MSAPVKQDAAFRYTEDGQDYLHYLGCKLRRPVSVPVQNIFEWRPSDPTAAARRVTVGGVAYDLIAGLRYEGQRQSLIDFVAAARRGASIEYLPSISSPSLSFPCDLVNAGDIAPDSDLWWQNRDQAEIRLRRSDGGNWKALLEAPLFYYRAGNSTGETFSRTGAASYEDEGGVLQSAAANISRTTWSLVNGVWTPALMAESERTNVVLHNRDLTNAAWTKTNCTAAKDQTGIDGVAASASKLTATAANATCLQAITLASSARWQSVYVKRVTGSGAIEMTMDNGATWTEITVTSEWARVEIPTQTLANPTVGFRIVTDTDAVAFDFVQNEGSGAVASSPISTTTAGVTRGAEYWRTPYTHAPQVDTTLYVKFRELSEPNWTSEGGNDPRIVAIGAAALTGPFAHLYKVIGAGTYRFLLRNEAAATSGGTVTLTPARDDIIELRAVIRRITATTVAVVLGGSKDGDTEVVSAAGTTIDLPSAWGDELLALASLSASVGQGDVEIITAFQMPGELSMAECRLV